jgi:hypothetical protein
MATITHTTVPSTTSPAEVSLIEAMRHRVGELLDDARTEQTLDRLASDADPRTSRELRLAWRRVA